MSKYIFYAPNPTSENRLSEEESFHACRVLRLKSGDPIYLLDGKGAKYAAILSNVDSKNTSFGQLSLVEKQEKIPYQIHIYVAPTKQMERMEWMVEKCCEFGIHGIHFFTCRNSERKEISISRSLGSKAMPIAPTLNSLSRGSSRGPSSERIDWIRFTEAFFFTSRIIVAIR
jgi:16S rRNA (uracil1498-N3)-methyltransferase